MGKEDNNGKKKAELRNAKKWTKVGLGYLIGAVVGILLLIPLLDFIVNLI